MIESADIYGTLVETFAHLVDGAGLASEEVLVTAKPLSPEEAIGNPDEDDYPLLKGRERLMQATFKGNVGQAFTDRHGNYRGELSGVIEMELVDNFNRAIFIATLNGVMRHLGLADKTVHCRDRGPRECSQALVNYIKERFGRPKVAMAGYQPRMVEALSDVFDLRVTDLDQENVGKERSGVTIRHANAAEEHIQWCDLMVVTGTTVVNGTIGQFIVSKPTIFYGVTIAGPAKILGLERFCHCAT